MTGGRMALVVGSQCRLLGVLSFLPKVTEELYSALTDPVVGHCVSALPGRSGLVVDPSLPALRASVREAFAHAHETRSTLFFAFVGHGQVGFDGSGSAGFSDYYLLSDDCRDPNRPSTGTAFLVGQELRELLRDFDQVDGLVALLHGPGKFVV